MRAGYGTGQSLSSEVPLTLPGRISAPRRRGWKISTPKYME